MKLGAAHEVAAALAHKFAGSRDQSRAADRAVLGRLFVRADCALLRFPLLFHWTHYRETRVWYGTADNSGGFDANLAAL